MSSMVTVPEKNESKYTELTLVTLICFLTKKKLNRRTLLTKQEYFLFIYLIEFIMNRLETHHRRLLDEHKAISITLAEFENKLMKKFKITSAEISNPETYWKRSLENEAKFKDLQQKTFLEENHQKFNDKKPEPEEYKNYMSYKMLSNCLPKNENDSSSIASSITNDLFQEEIDEEISQNHETIENETELILIRSKSILIELIDKEIDRYSKKNPLVDESGAGDSNKKSEEKQKRLNIIAKIKSELEILESLEKSV